MIFFGWKERGEGKSALFSLLFLLCGIYGVALLLSAVPQMRWNRPAVFLLAPLPGIVLWYLNERQEKYRRLLLLAGLLGIPALAELYLFFHFQIAREIAAAILQLAGFAEAGESDVTAGVLFLLWIVAYILFLWEFIFHAHWLIYLLMSALLLAAPLFGIVPGNGAVLCIGIFQITFWTVHTLIKKSSRKRKREKRNVFSAMKIGVLMMAMAAVIFGGSLFVVERNPQWFYETAYQAEGMVQQTVKRVSGWSNQPDGGNINRGNLYPGNVDQLEVRVSDLPAETLYLQGFHGGDYGNGQWEPAMDDEIFLRMNENTLYWRYWEDSIGSMFSNLYYQMNQNTDRGFTLREHTLVIRNMETTRGQSTEYAPYYGIQSRRGRFGSMFRYYEQGEMSIDWDHVDPSMESGASWYRDIQEAYQKEAQETYTRVPREEIPRLVKLCEANPQSDLEHITAFIIDTLQHMASYSTTPGVTPLHADPVEYFLFENQEGYCQHFASAAVLMYRLYGIPARYVTGYAVDPSAFIEIAGGYIAEVTDVSAHAWPEIFIEDLGWTPVEVTPSGNNYAGYEAGMDIPALEEMAGEQQWNPDSLLEDVPQQEDNTEEPAETAVEPADPSPSAPSGVQEVSPGILLLLFALLAGAFYYMYREMQKAADRRMNVRQAFGRMLEALHYAGELPEYDGSEEDFAKRFSDVFPEESPEDIIRVVDVVRREAFGNREASPEDEAFVRDFCRKVRDSVSARQRGIKKFLYKYVKFFC